MPRAALQSLTWCSSSSSFYLVLVGGVEGDFCHFGVPCSHVTDAATAHLDAFQQGRLRRVSCRVPLGKQTQSHISTVAHI